MRFDERTRREFLRATPGAGAGLLLASAAGALPQARSSEPEEEVAPAEDLMREHGVLNRILLIYEESLRRIDSGLDLAPETLASAAGIIRRFIEEYHEKLEEESLFPRFEKARKLLDLVGVLAEQHKAGRQLTGEIQEMAGKGRITAAADRAKLARSLRLFIRMYRPHEAREDTVLFPAIRSIVSRREYEELGDAFEEKEHKLFGKEGFEGIVVEVAGLEKKLGIYELSLFTPK
jgi:hemerythrin-like domain-containing protein